MTADQPSGFGRDVGGLKQLCTAGGGKILLLSGVDMDSLRIRLCGHCSAVGHVDADAKWQHDIHPNHDWRRFEADDDNEAGSSSSFVPLEVKVLVFSL